MIDYIQLIWSYAFKENAYCVILKMLDKIRNSKDRAVHHTIDNVPSYVVALSCVDTLFNEKSDILCLCGEDPFASTMLQ